MKKVGEVIFLDKNINDLVINKDLLNIKYDNNINPTIPTILVGYEEVKKLYNNISIFEKQIDYNLFWTYSYTEHSISYRNDIDNFTLNLYDLSIQNIKYKFIDIIIEDLLTYNKIFNRVSLNKESVIYRYDNLLYIYNRNEEEVFGLDLDYMSYLNINTDVLLDYIINNSKSFYEESFKDDGYIKNISNHLNKDVNSKYVVTFIE